MHKRTALLTALATLLLSWTLLGVVLALGWTPKLGLDLQGGFSVRLTAPEGTSSDVLDKAVEIMRRRIEALGNVQEPEIQVAGDRSIEVQLPGVQERDRALAAVGSTGDLSFRPVISVGQVPGFSPIFNDLQITPPGLDQDGATTDTSEGGETTTTTTLPPPTGNSTPFTVCVVNPDGSIGRGQSQSYPLGVIPAGVDGALGVTVDDDPAQEAWLVDPVTGVVYYVGPALLSGVDIDGATAEFTNQWVVDPSFSGEGGARFEAATACLNTFPFGSVNRQFAIVLDGEVVSAPQVREDTPPEGLDAGNAVITVGGAEEQQADAEDLATVLQYGALPTTFEADNTVAVSATLGSDSLRAGLIAGIGGLILVGLAMLAYYRMLGVITVLGLSAFGSFVLVILGVLSETQGLTLTLAGVTGIVVSIGITSDSYIVYFERIKEEVRNGRPLRAAVDSAFPRAFRTILTADFVSISGSVLLWLLAVGPVRGFAISLGIATAVDVVVAYFFTRPAAAYLIRTRFAEGGSFSVRGAVGSPIQDDVATAEATG